MKRLSDVGAALLGSIALLPGLAAVATVTAAAFVGDGRTDILSRLFAVAGGFGLGVLMWAVLAVLTHPYARADRANMRMYRELVQRLVSARSSHESTCSPELPENLAGRAACQESASHIAALESTLGTPNGSARGGPDWVVGAGYIAAWQQLHRAEEALLEVVPASAATAGAIYDVQRLEGSRIPQRAQLLGLAQTAVQTLSPGFGAQLRATNGRAVEGAPAAPKVTPEEARAVIRRTRQVINDYRDDAAGGLVTLRRRMSYSVVFTGLVAYLILALAVVAAVPLVAVISASVLYLVGALVGLLQRLHAESKLQGEKQLDDYGLTTTKMIHLALLSGMAALAGVALVGMLSGGALGAMLGPQAVDQQTIELSAVFDLLRYPAGLIVAAVFGLTPGLLLSQLGDQGEALKSALATTDADSADDDEVDR